MKTKDRDGESLPPLSPPRRPGSTAWSAGILPAGAVTPAKAGVHFSARWIPAFAGMTGGWWSS